MRPGNIRVADLARGEVPAAAGEVVVVPGVRPGFTCEVGVRTILRRLVMAGQAGQVQLSGADVCRIAVVGQAVSVDELTGRIRELVSPCLPPDQPDAPPGWVEVATPAIEFSTAGGWQVAWPDAAPLIAGRNLITVTVAGRHGSRRLSVPLTVHTYARTPQAVTTLTRGQDVDAGALGWVWTDLARSGASAVTEADHLAGMMLARDLAPGEPVTERDLVPRPLVHRGELVDLVVHRGRVAAVVRAECRQDGHQGQLVSVLNPLTKRPVLASVTGPGVVTLGR